MLRGLLLAILVLPFMGCGSGDVDPNQKVDAPGYYNGPMKSKGGGAGEAAKSGDGKTDAGQ